MGKQILLVHLEHRHGLSHQYEPILRSDLWRKHNSRGLGLLLNGSFVGQCSDALEIISTKGLTSTMDAELSRDRIVQRVCTAMQRFEHLIAPAPKSRYCDSEL
ncbi:MAG: hypothetical protein CL573_03975 [Alphaproteobacteria bacterium]|nr:hypothetical protein [Alphaproteobacteria bacterium]